MGRLIPFPAPSPRRSLLHGSARDRAESLVQRCGDGTRLTAHGWMVRCPAHDDHTPSLSIDARDDRVLLTCFAGCTPAAIVAALGVTMADLFGDDLPVPRLRPRPPRRQEGRAAPLGPAEEVALHFAVDFVLDDITMLDVDGLAETLRQAALDPGQRLWVEQKFRQGGLTSQRVWEILFPEGLPALTVPRPVTPTLRGEVTTRRLDEEHH
jgi:hypothetical protein